MKEKNKQLTALVLMLSFIGLVLYGFNYLGNQQTEAARIKSEQAKQVSVIPPGTEEAWQAFIDRRVAAVLRREGRLVKLDDDSHRKLMEKASYVSNNAPYQITCDLTTASVQFGTDSDTNQGVNDSVEFYFNVKPEGTTAAPGYIVDQPPPVGVPQESIAAATLRDHVCQYLANKVQALFSAQ